MRSGGREFSYFFEVTWRSVIVETREVHDYPSQDVDLKIWGYEYDIR